MKYQVVIAWNECTGKRRETRGSFDTAKEAREEMVGWANTRYPDDPNEVENDAIDFGDGVCFVEAVEEE